MSESKSKQFAVLKQDLVLRTGVHLQHRTIQKQPRKRFQGILTFPGGETAIVSVDEETVRKYSDVFEVREA